jgi:hypothetical protein
MLRKPGPRVSRTDSGTPVPAAHPRGPSCQEGVGSLARWPVHSRRGWSDRFGALPRSWLLAAIAQVAVHLERPEPVTNERAADAPRPAALPRPGAGLRAVRGGRDAGLRDRNRDVRPAPRRYRDPGRHGPGSSGHPRRTCTQSHIDYIIEASTRAASRAADLPRMRIVSQPRHLRHFTARFAPLH